jgi:phage terminase small subunit
MRDLTVKQSRFVEAYLANGRNGAEAYRTAYNTKAGAKTVANEADKLLSHPDIAPIIQRAAEEAKRALDRVLERYAVTEERVTRELALLGFANMADYMRPGANGLPVLDFAGLTRDQMAALTELTVEEFKVGRGVNAREVRRVKFKLADKRAALVDLGRKLKMFSDKTEHSGGMTMELLVRGSYEA